MTKLPVTPPTSAAILAGGLSRRIGANKALLRLEPEGPTLIEMVVKSLEEAGLGEGLLVVANTPEDYGFLGLSVVPDDILGVGPLGGILTALSHSPCERVLVVACDMPALNPYLLRHMAGLPDDADVIIPRWCDKDGQARLETLHTVYSRRCVEPILKRIEAGKLHTNSLLDDVTVRYVDEEELRRFDPDLCSFRNINTPSDALQDEPT